MVILGLGSNMGDRMHHLRRALSALKTVDTIKIIKVSPLYMSDALLPENAPADWDMPYINLAIALETSLRPIDLLHTLKNIEWSIGRKPEVRHWGPRVLDIDILAWGEIVIDSEPLCVPHNNLQERPFALWPLADLDPLWKFPLSGPNAGKTAAQIVEQWGSRFDGNAPFHTRQINQRIDTPAWVGIINVTPDSFSDGGKFTDVDSCIHQAENLVLGGAEIIDIGAESTSPKAAAITPKQEWQRLGEILQALKTTSKNFLIQPKISVDTRNVEVAKTAIDLGVDWINDVTGLDDHAMQALIASANVDCVVMHHIKIPERRDHVLPRDQDPNEHVLHWGEERIKALEAKGIAREKIIFDPGIGFGKMAEQSLIVLQNISLYKKLGVRILVGHSRKTFLGLISQRNFADRDIETAGMAIALCNQPIDYLRVHAVDLCARAVKGFKAVSSCI